MANEEHLELIRQGGEVWNRWRSENPNIRPDFRDARLLEERLSGADLRGANFNYAVLYDANLGGANLSGAGLYRTDLGSAKLIGANLTSVQCFNTRFQGADLTNADLTNARLNGADFSYADLSGANLGGARLFFAFFIDTNLRDANICNAQTGDTVFVNTDLRGVKGLESVVHKGPSKIGVDTIHLSEGQIPEIFLRGCGMPESFIVQIPSLVTATQPIQFYSCFISYSHADKFFARRLHDALQGRGIRCWLDEHQMLPGDDIFEQIDRGIRLWDKVLLCCSKDSLTSWWVDDEITKAYEKEQALMRHRGEKVLTLIPLNLDGYLFLGEWRSGKASQIKSRLAADFTNWEADNRKFEEQLERLVHALRTDASGREAPPTPQL